MPPQQQHAKRLELVALPAYAPELNPEEAIWKHLKYVEFANVCCESLHQLKDELHLVVQRLRQKPHVIRGCFAQAGHLI